MTGSVLSRGLCPVSLLSALDESCGLTRAGRPVRAHHPARHLILVGTASRVKASGVGLRWRRSGRFINRDRLDNARRADLLIAAWERADGRKVDAARLLGVSRPTLDARIRRVVRIVNERT